jgi:hypothetical protein
MNKESFKEAQTVQNQIDHIDSILETINEKGIISVGSKRLDKYNGIHGKVSDAITKTLFEMKRELEKEFALI